jgi:Na+-transporting NADH:ubiquinone oxidoreductase subunit C
MSEKQAGAFKSIIFAATLCVACSLLLTTAATGLKDYQLQNIQTDRQKNILMAAKLIDEKSSLSSAELAQSYQDSIRKVYVGTDGAMRPAGDSHANGLPLYLVGPEDALEAYIVPIDTNGLWGKIHGYLALENDGKTVRGFTVYKHSETPGLGGEIEKRWFQNQFEGKKIATQYGDFVSIGITKGETDDIHSVDGISGATLTGEYLSQGLKDILQDYEPVAIKFRNRNTTKAPLGNM